MRASSGEGPGEFQLAIGLFRLGDGIAVLDIGLARITLYTAGGDLVRAIPAPPLPRPSARDNVLAVVPATLIGVLADTTLVVQGPGYFLSRGQPGWSHVVGGLARIDTCGNVLATHGDHVVMQFFEAGDRANPIVTAGGHAPVLSLAVAEDRIALTTGATFEIRLYRPDGTLIFREDRQAMPAPRSGRPDDKPHPDLQPTCVQVLLDPNGNLLAREYSLQPGARQLWTVINGEGRLVGRYRLPQGFRLLQAWNDTLYGVHVDEDVGTQRVMRLIPR